MPSVFKATLQFTLTTAISTPNFPTRRIGGWSESVYSNLASIGAILQAMGIQQVQAPQGGGGGGGGGAFGPIGLAGARAALLPKGAAITGIRIQPIAPVGPAQSFPTAMGGNLAAGADIPQQALLVKSVGLGINSIRRFTIRGIPDSEIVEGEFQPDAGFNTALNAWITQLTSGPWGYYPKFGTTTPNKIITITAAGVVTCESLNAYQVGTMVRITKSRDSGGNLRSGRFLISVIGPGTNQLTITNWNFGATTGGSMNFDKNQQFAQFDPANTSVGRAVTRKVGRPSNQYRGRRSRKR